MQEFEISGYWYLPDKAEDKNRIPGFLKFDHQNGPVLTLTREGMLFDNIIEHAEEYPIILGNTDRGAVTLVNNLATSQSTGSWVTRITLVASIVIEGHHFKSIDEIFFKNVSVSYTYLVDWAHKPLSDEELADPWKSHVLDPIDVQLNRTRLSFWHSRSGNSQVYRTTVQREFTVSIEPYEPFNLEECYLYFNYHLRNFFTFATDRVNHPVFISAQLSESDLRPVSIYYLVREHFEKSRDVFPHLMLFSLDDVRDELAFCLSNWIDNSDAYSTAHIQYFKTMYQGCLDVETKFLFLAQALERICKTQLGKKYRSYKVALKSLCGVLARDHEEVIGRLVPNREEFLEQVKETRNMLSHADRQPDAISSGYEFWQYNQRMTILVQIFFLRQMGLPTDKITQLMLRNRLFRHLTKEWI